MYLDATVLFSLSCRASQLAPRPYQLSLRSQAGSDVLPARYEALLASLMPSQLTPRPFQLAPRPS